MTLTHALLLIGWVISFGLGWWGHYKYGTKLASLETKIKSVVP